MCKGKNEELNSYASTVIKNDEEIQRVNKDEVINFIRNLDNIYTNEQLKAYSIFFQKITNF